MFCLLAGSAMAQSTATSTATPTGSGSWTVPAGVWKITKLEAYGAGGGGGNATVARSAGAGGGSGAYASASTDISVIPGSNVLDFSVGTAGTGGQRGGTSYVKESASSSSYYVRATGGYAGATATVAGSGSSTTSTATATSTLANAPDGDTKTSGKKGYNGSITRTRSGNWLNYSYSYSGTGGAGGNNVNSTGRGFERNTAGAGNPATAIGAGGGGALNTSTSTQSTYVGGTGGAGQVIITYEVLTLHVTIDANGGTTSATDFDILYYNKFGSNLPEATLDGYTFLGWYTDGGVKMTADSLCKETSDFTLKAHFLKAGAIADGSTTAQPCQNFTVYSETAADTRGDAFTYSWSYTVNGGTPVELNVNKAQLTQEDLTLDQMGTYVFTRYVTALGQTVASTGNYTINVASVNPGEITTGLKYICTTGSFTIGSTTDATTTSTGTIVYQWRYSKDGGAEIVVPNSDTKELTQADVTLTGAGTYVFKRYATIACAEPVASTGEYTLYVTALPVSYAAPTSNYDKFCVGGEVEVTGADYNLPGVTSPYNIPTSFNWMISKDEATPETAGNNATFTQELGAIGSYEIYAAIVYFNDNACAVNTLPVTVFVIDDPTIAVPTLSETEVCPNGSVTLTAAAPTGGVGGEYTYNWEFKAAGSDTWNAVSASEATYDQYTGTSITASNFTSMGAVQYRSYVSNTQGCDAYSDAVNLTVTIVEVPVVRGDTLVCPEAGKFITFKATTTDPAFFLRWYENATTNDCTTTTPEVSMENELDTTNYVAQFNPNNGCVSARVPDAIYISYSAHLQYVDASGDLDQTACQNNPIVDIQFTHGGDCEPQIAWDPAMPDGVTIDNSVAGLTTITGAPTKTGTYTYHVALLSDGMTLCAAPNHYDGSFTVNSVYNVTENKTICGGGYTIADKMGHSYTFTESGTYTKTLESVTGCDSIVTLNLYVHEWNQFGFKENEELIAGWTSFSSVTSPINADEPGSVSGSRITYSGWNGSNERRDNLASTSMVSESGYSLGLINQSGTSGTTSNNGKSIVISTSTKDFGNLKLHFDYGAERYQSIFGIFSSNDKAFTDITYRIATATGSADLSSTHVELEQSTLTTGSVDIDLSASEDLRNLIENQDNITITLTFSGGDRSSGFIPEQYFRIDNICISGEKINTLEVTGESQACTNQSVTLMATPPYINTNVNPNDTTPVIYKWERIVGDVSTVLEENSFLLTDFEVQPGYNKYVVSVGEGACGQSDTIDVLGIVPAYHPEIERHGYVCSNEVDQVSNITFTDECKYVDGMFIVYPEADAMRTPDLYECQLSIPTTTNPCDSVITLWLDVRKAFDTTVVANICLGETYSEFGFDITPTVEGVTYHTSNPTWTCSTGCDSIYRLTLITSSVQQTLSSETNVTLAAWPMDQGTNKFVPACGVRTANSSFMVYGGEHMPSFSNTTGHAPSSDYCYAAASSNGALNWANLSSSCSGLMVSPSYVDYSGAYFEIRINPYDYENLKLKFDYLRQNASTNNAQAFNRVNYSYKFSETGSYTSLGYVNINSTSWASQTLDFSSANAIDHEVMYLKVEFEGGNAGNTESCGLLQGSRYLPSYITIDNVKIWGDRPARATLNAAAQTCDKNYVCEGEEVTFTCQGDDAYFKFYVVDETTNEETAFAGNTTLSITPTQTTTYTIKAVDQNTGCDSSWHFEVELVKKATITYVSGSYDAGICGNNEFDLEISVENSTAYTFEWLTSGGVKPEGIVFNNDESGNITIQGVISDGGFARYYINATQDSRCFTTDTSVIGTLATRVNPQITQTIGSDSVCQGTDMQFVISNKDDLNFVLVPESERYKWTAADATLSIKDTLMYTADEAIHSTRHYLTVKQNGCTTVDSLDIVVYDLAGDTLNAPARTYVLNYGENYLPEDSLIVPDLMHKGNVVQANFIDTAYHTGGAKIYAPSVDNLTTFIAWTIVDKCGNTHTKTQVLNFVLPPCGDEDHYTVDDYEGNTYHTVRMGWNCWMKENLKSTRYADGSEIAVANGYNGDLNPEVDVNIEKFGRLYTWYSAVKIAENSTASTPLDTNEFKHIQGVCPDGWYLPNRECFASLNAIEMTHMRKQGDAYWMDGGGDNTTGMSLVGAGMYNCVTHRYENLLGNTYFWTSDDQGESGVKSFVADCNCYTWYELVNDKKHAFSVRCVKERE